MKRKEFAIKFQGRKAIFFSTLTLMLCFVFLASHPANARLDLSITKSGPGDSVVEGGVFTYTIEATIPDPGGSGIVVTDTMPGGISYEFYCREDLITGTIPFGSSEDIICTLVSLDEKITGTFPITIRALLNTSEQGTITNTVAIGGSEPDPNPVNNIDAVATAINQPEPSLTISPDRLDVFVEPFGTVTETLTISNTGHITVTWEMYEQSCRTPADIPWVSQDPMTGTIPPGDVYAVTVMFDATGIRVTDTNIFTDTLCLRYNPDIDIPISMTIRQPPLHQTPVPTLRGWGMILMVVLLGVSAVFFVRKRRAV